MHNLLKCFMACKDAGVRPTRFVLAVNVATQSVYWFEKSRWQSLTGRRYRFRKKFRCSTSRFGVGQAEGSNRTPRGLHRIAEKIGGGWPVGAAFESRELVGFTWRGQPSAKITTRILWLEGLQPGLNRGLGVDSRERYIYIHGTGDERSLGRPASSGCIHLAANDLVPLFDQVPGGTLVWIE